MREGDLPLGKSKGSFQQPGVAAARELAQYVALRNTERLADAGALASIGTMGDSYDNALAESVTGLNKPECVRLDGPVTTVEELELATLPLGRRGESLLDRDRVRGRCRTLKDLCSAGTDH